VEPVNVPGTKMSLANRNKIGMAYGAVTIALVATIFGSGWCWGSQSGPGSSEGLHDVCLTIWVTSGILLAVSQIIFIVIALGMNHNATATLDLTPGTPARATPASVTKVVILAFAALVLVVIALFIYALSGMPS
jgi:hypothetical protein